MKNGIYRLCLTGTILEPGRVVEVGVTGTRPVWASELETLRLI